MVKVAVFGDDGNYTVVLASNSDTPYQILTHKNINPETRKVFINGIKAANEKINTPLYNIPKCGGMVYIAVKI